MPAFLQETAGKEARFTVDLYFSGRHQAFMGDECLSEKPSGGIS
ncbi:hypothetical protein [Neisseria sp. 83E34]|nr:hypothetical protein [Neisseria sp. 83E34]